MSFINRFCNSLSIYDSLAAKENVDLDSVKNLCEIAGIGIKDLEITESANEQNLIGRVKQLCPEKNEFTRLCLQKLNRYYRQNDMSFIVSVYHSLSLYDSILRGESVDLDSLKNLCELVGIKNRDPSEISKERCPSKDQFVYRCLKLDKWVEEGGSPSAAERICKCFIERETTLDLSNTGITNFPKWFHQLDFIEEVNVSSNKLELSSGREQGMVYPKNIRKLDISDTEDALNAYQLFGLKKLTHLIARNNKTSVYKAEFSHLLDNLEELDLRGNNLSERSIQSFQSKLKKDAIFYYDLPKKRSFEAASGPSKRTRYTPPPESGILDDIDRMETEYAEQAARQRKQMANDERAKDLSVLNLKPGATDEEIRKAYRKELFKIHPDKMGADYDKMKDYAEKRRKEIEDVMERLLD